jgi:hypothetical protein
MNSPKRAPSAPRRYSENEVAWILYDWFNGADIPAAGLTYCPWRDLGMVIKPEGDTLTVRGIVVASRNPPDVPPQSPPAPGERAQHSYARALCRTVVGGYFPRLYPLKGRDGSLVKPLVSGDRLQRLYRNA